MKTHAFALVSALVYLGSAGAALVERDVEYKQDGAFREVTGSPAGDGMAR